MSKMYRGFRVVVDHDRAFIYDGDRFMLSLDTYNQACTWIDSWHRANGTPECRAWLGPRK